jgi:hypothetical protein
VARIPARAAKAAPGKHPLVVAIDAAIEADDGALFRTLLGKYMPTIKDAYRGAEDKFRAHFGFSTIGKECARELYYNWRWVARKKFPARIIRLFNRGHIEEARFLALLAMVGVTIHDGDGEGGQERLSAYNGHAGSALDGLLYNVPGAMGEWILGEFKTHGTKPFIALVAANSIRVAKPEHYAQMQACMEVRGIHRCLYLAVNKNDDDLYAEIVEYDAPSAKHYMTRAGGIIFATTIPPKITTDASDFRCKFCDRSDVCHYNAKVLTNCRTCKHSIADPGGTWGCGLRNIMLDRDAQAAGCEQYVVHPDLG